MLNLRFNPQPDELPTQGPIFEEDGGSLASVVSAIAGNWYAARAIGTTVAALIAGYPHLTPDEFPTPPPPATLDDDTAQAGWVSQLWASSSADQWTRARFSAAAAPASNDDLLPVPSATSPITFTELTSGSALAVADFSTALIHVVPGRLYLIVFDAAESGGNGDVSDSPLSAEGGIEWFPQIPGFLARIAYDSLATHQRLVYAYAGTPFIENDVTVAVSFTDLQDSIRWYVIEIQGAALGVAGSGNDASTQAFKQVGTFAADTDTLPFVKLAPFADPRNAVIVFTSSPSVVDVPLFYRPIVTIDDSATGGAGTVGGDLGLGWFQGIWREPAAIFDQNGSDLGPFVNSAMLAFEIQAGIAADDDTAPAPYPYPVPWLQPQRTAQEDEAAALPRQAIWEDDTPVAARPWPVPLGLAPSDDEQLPQFVAPTVVSDDDPASLIIWPARVTAVPAPDDAEGVQLHGVFDDDTPVAPVPWPARHLQSSFSEEEPVAPSFTPSDDDDARRTVWPTPTVSATVDDEQLATTVAAPFVPDTDDVQLSVVWPATIVHRPADDSDLPVTPSLAPDDFPAASAPTVWPSVWLRGQFDDEVVVPTPATSDEDAVGATIWVSGWVRVWVDDEQLVQQPVVTVVSDDDWTPLIVWAIAPAARLAVDDEQLALGTVDEDGVAPRTVWASSWVVARDAQDDELSGRPWLEEDGSRGAIVWLSAIVQHQRVAEDEVLRTAPPEDETLPAPILPAVRFTYIPVPEDQNWLPVVVTVPIYPLGATVTFLGQYARVSPEPSATVVAGTLAAVATLPTKASVVKNWEG